MFSSFFEFDLNIYSRRTHRTIQKRIFFLFTFKWKQILLWIILLWWIAQLCWWSFFIGVYAVRLKILEERKISMISCKTTLLSRRTWNWFTCGDFNVIYHSVHTIFFLIFQKRKTEENCHYKSRFEKICLYMCIVFENIHFHLILFLFIVLKCSADDAMKHNNNNNNYSQVICLCISNLLLENWEWKRGKHRNQFIPTSHHN